MVARLHRTTVLLLWVAALAWFGFHGGHGRWWTAGLGALLLLNLQPIVLAIEFFVLVPLINRADPAPRPSWRQLVRAWWRESVTAHDVFGWQQPFRAQRHPDTIDHPASRGRRAVVLVHGFMCNRGLWNRWMPALRAAGVPFVAPSLEPPFGDIDAYAEQLDEAIERAVRATGLPPLLVCHSMGGLAARAWWRRHASTAAERVHGVITIGTPHRGTFTARLARAANARQMRQACEWLNALDLCESDDCRRRFTCFYSHCDNIAMPASTATLPGADNRHLDGEPHVALAYAPQVRDEVMRRLAEPAVSAR